MGLHRFGLRAWLLSGLFLLFAPQIAASLFQNNLTTALLLAPNVLIACLSSFVLQYFVTFQQIKKYTWLSLFNVVLGDGPRSLFVLSGYGLEGAVIALLIEQLVVFSIMMYLIVAEIGLAIPKLTHVRHYLLWRAISPGQYFELDRKFKRSLSHCVFFQVPQRWATIRQDTPRNYHQPWSQHR